MSRKKIGQIFPNIILILLSSMVIFPFIYVVAVSFSNERDIIDYGYSLIPKRFDLTAYKYVLGNPKAIKDAYFITIFTSVVYTAASTFLMACMAYALSVKEFRMRNQLSFFVYFTMLFNGGLVSTFILITRYLHLNDSIWVYLLPHLINPWHMFMIRTNFQGMPDSVVESALLDGASEFKIFFKIACPITKPILATVALFGFLAKWNDWMTSLLYINKSNLISLQYLLQRLMADIKFLEANQMDSAGLSMNFAEIPIETVKMAMVIVVAGPALVIFPFFQKYFVKGITVGSVKG